MKKIARLGLVGLVVVNLVYAVGLSEAIADSQTTLARGTPTEWRVKAYKIDLVRDQTGISGDVLRREDTGWIYLGSNHLEGGSIRYTIPIGRLDKADILEIWIDGYSDSNNPDVGPTILVGGRNLGQVTRRVGDAWKPKVFRFADDLVYGEDPITPSERNESWRIRFPSNKYDSNQINRDPGSLVGPDGRLPIEISMTGSDGFVIKRVEVDVYKNITGGEFDRDLDLRITDIYPNPAYTGDFVTVRFSRSISPLAIDLYIIDPDGFEHLKARNPEITTNSISFLASGSPFFKTGLYRARLVFRSGSRTTTDVDSFYFYTRFAKPYVESPQAYTAPPPPQPYARPPQAYLVPPPPQPYPEPPRPYIAPPPPQPLYESPPPSVHIAPVPGRSYTIQVSANRVQYHAIKLQERLRRRGYPAYISETYIPGLGHFFRVRVGTYPDRYTAEREAYHLRIYEGLQTWVTRDSPYWSQSSLEQAPLTLSETSAKPPQKFSQLSQATRSGSTTNRTTTLAKEEKPSYPSSISVQVDVKPSPPSAQLSERPSRPPEVLPLQATTAPMDSGESEIEEVVWNTLTQRSIPGYSYEVKEIKVTGDQAKVLVVEESRQGKIKRIHYGLEKKNGRWIVQSTHDESRNQL